MLKQVLHIDNSFWLCTVEERVCENVKWLLSSKMFDLVAISLSSSGYWIVFSHIRLASVCPFGFRYGTFEIRHCPYAKNML